MTEDAARTARLAYQASLPKKCMAAGCLFLDSARRVLLVKPSDKSVWLMPGGVVEADESPLACCRREMMEEIGLNCAITRLLVVDYKAAGPDRTESQQFIYWGGTLTPDEVTQIHVDGHEIVGYDFFAEDALPAALTRGQRRRILAAWRQVDRHGAVYLETQTAPED